MNAELFIQYLREYSIFGRLYDHAAISVDLAFVVALFSESKKRSMRESEKNIVADAAAALIAEHHADFNEWRRKQSTGFFYAFGERDFSIVASELASHIMSSHTIKRMVTQWLREFRAELFDEASFKTFLNELCVEEHPMQTFVLKLDFIEGMKGTAEYSSWLNLKRNLTNLHCVGNAMLDRSEWQSTAHHSKG